MTDNKVREYRERLGFSQTELARRAKVASQNLSAIENGRLAPWPKVRRALARVLQVPQSELFPGNGNSGN